MRSVWWLNACSTLTLTLPLLFSPHPLGSRREQLLPEFPPQRSPFLPRPPLPVPLKILQAPLPLPRLRSSLLPRRPLERSEEHTSELQSRGHLVCRLLLEKKKKI